MDTNQKEKERGRYRRTPANHLIVLFLARRTFSRRSAGPRAQWAARVFLASVIRCRVVCAVAPNSRLGSAAGRPRESMKFPQNARPFAVPLPRSLMARPLPLQLPLVLAALLLWKFFG